MLESWAQWAVSSVTPYRPLSPDSNANNSSNSHGPLLVAASAAMNVNGIAAASTAGLVREPESFQSCKQHQLEESQVVPAKTQSETGLSLYLAN